MEVKNTFSCSFDGTEVEISDFKFTIIESFIAKATNCLEVEKSGSKIEESKGRLEILLEKCKHGHYHLQKRYS